MSEKKKTVPLKILLAFKISNALQKKLLKERYGKRKADMWLNRSGELFRSIYPQIPDIGGKENVMNKNLVLSTFLMPIAVVMKEEGLPTREIGEHIFNLSKRSFEVLLPLTKGLSYASEVEIEKMKRAAKRSINRDYPGDWVFEFVDGGDKYLYGYDMVECGIHKFWRDRGLEELVPYLCLTDWAKWELLGVSVERTKTLANGHDVCDFRYCREGKCPSGWPPESNIEWTGKFEGGN